MPETFFILLAGGIMFAAAVSDPRQVTLQWLRLAGILALSMASLGMFFLSLRVSAMSLSFWIGTAVIALPILFQLAFAQTGRIWLQEVFAGLAYVVAVVLGASSLNIKNGYGPFVAASGISAMVGLVLMDMLLGHAYLTASKMTIAPFVRLNVVLAMVMIVRTACVAIGVPWVNSFRPVYLLWGQYGLLIITRVLVGLLVPGVFVYMAHDCIKRRATQSATGILYVTGVLVFIGELLALYLVRATGLPF